jgi:hypothetical protein
MAVGQWLTARSFVESFRVAVARRSAVDAPPAPQNKSTA